MSRNCRNDKLENINMLEVGFKERVESWFKVQPCFSVTVSLISISK